MGKTSLIIRLLRKSYFIIFITAFAVAVCIIAASAHYHSAPQQIKSACKLCEAPFHWGLQPEPTVADFSFHGSYAVLSIPDQPILPIIAFPGDARSPPLS
jgi:hypothetical protein